MVSKDWVIVFEKFWKQLIDSHMIKKEIYNVLGDSQILLPAIKKRNSPVITIILAEICIIRNLCRVNPNERKFSMRKNLLGLKEVGQ